MENIAVAQNVSRMRNRVMKYGRMSLSRMLRSAQRPTGV